MAHRGVGVVVPAAGSGRRIGGRKKPFLLLRGEPLLLHTLRPLLAHPRVVSLVVALPPEDAATPPEWLLRLDSRVRVVAGGATRGESVRRGLEALPAEAGIAVIHDGARPLLDPEILDRCIAAVAPGRGAVAGVPAVDTLKEVDGRRRVLCTPDRSRIWQAQTPQAFPREMIVRAYEEAAARGIEGTDDAELVEWTGSGEVTMVEGSPWNLKVTRAEDLEVAALLLERGVP